MTKRNDTFDALIATVFALLGATLILNVIKRLVFGGITRDEVE